MNSWNCVSLANEACFDASYDLAAVVQKCDFTVCAMYVTLSHLSRQVAHRRSTAQHIPHSNVQMLVLYSLNIIMMVNSAAAARHLFLNLPAWVFMLMSRWLIFVATMTPFRSIHCDNLKA